MIRCKQYFLNWLLSITLFMLIMSSIQAAGAVKVKFAVVTLGAPSQKYAQWYGFAEHLKLKSGYDIELVAPKNIKELEHLIDSNDVDIFFLNSFIFYRLKNKGKASGLAQMQNLDGEIMSHSKIFVRNDSGINKIEDLKGKNFSFVSPLGSGGYLAPRAMFQKHGINTKKDLKEHFTRNVANTIHSVLLNEVQAGSMCGVNYRLLSNKIDSGKLKIIAKSDDYPENLIATSSGMNKSVKDKIQYYLFNMSKDKDGKEVLKTMQTTHGMKIKSFVPYDSNVERITEKLIEQAGMKID